MGRPAKERPNTELNRSERPQRSSINGLRDKLSVKGQEPGFHYCFVNDYNVDSYIESSYEFVTHDVQIGAKHINSAAQIDGKVSMPVGNGVTAFLMRIPDEYYHEDFAEAQSDLDSKEIAMSRELNSKSDGRYGKVEIAAPKPA